MMIPDQYRTIGADVYPMMAVIVDLISYVLNGLFGLDTF